MPVVSTFFGIIVRMFFDDYEPPHFHVEYQGQSATFDFAGKLLTGELAPSEQGVSFGSGRVFTNTSFA